MNFYKPYNIEIDVNVRDENETTVVDRFNEYMDLISLEDNKAEDKDTLASLLDKAHQVKKALGE